MKYFILFLCLCISFLTARESVSVHKDIVYNKVGERALHLDIYFPKNEKSPFLLVWIHGGAWRSGSKEDFPRQFLDYGFAIASIEYRLSEVAQFPAQIYDIKAAIRFLRANAQKYGYQSEKITIAGSSAGGHLAALVGTTNDNSVLEGNLGKAEDISSSVQAVVDYFGPTNLITILKQSTPHGLSVRKPALELLLGMMPEDDTENAILASSALQVDKDDPPLYILHGDQDPQVPVNQSLELYTAYKNTGLDVELDIISGAGHGGDVFFNEKYMNNVVFFLDRVLNRKTFSKDSRRHEDVPQGTVTKYQWRSKIFANTVRDYYVYIPAQYKPEQPAALMIFQDGHTYVNPEGDQRVPIVFDNLIHQGKMPVTIGLFINPGHKGSTKPERPWDNNNRSIEYDSLSNDYSRFLIEEMIPEISKKYNISSDRKMHAIGGLSSGAICAFTAAWQKPDYFQKVLSQIGSFTDIKGGHNYPPMIRKREKRDIKIFLQDGSNDLDNEHGNWWLSNLQMEAALKYRNYDYKYVGGYGGHSGQYGGQILPESLIWLWSDVINIEK